MEIAHRGLWTHQNRISGIVKVSKIVDAIEIDCRLNSNGVMVLCHDKDSVDEDNDTLKDLCIIPESLNLILDIKGNYAHEVLEIIKGSKHVWQLSSFDYRCVDTLLQNGGYKIGLITDGMPPEFILEKVDFISQSYEFIDDEIINKYKKYKLIVYIFGTDKWTDNVDGCIRNIKIEGHE